MEISRTVVDIVRHTSTALAVDGAHILLQAGICNATRAVRNRTIFVLRLWQGRSQSGEGEDNGGSCELHFGSRYLV